MGFFGNLFSAAVKTALTPVAIATDVIKVIKEEEPDATKNLLKSAKEDIEEAGDDLTEGEL